MNDYVFSISIFEYFDFSHFDDVSFSLCVSCVLCVNLGSMNFYSLYRGLYLACEYLIVSISVSVQMFDDPTQFVHSNKHNLESCLLCRLDT